jgi:hypothetical protein
VRERLFHKSAEHSTVLMCDCTNATRVALAVVVRERQRASSDQKPPVRGFSRLIDDEANRACIAGSRSCRVDVLELGFESPAREGASAGSGIVQCHHSPVSGAIAGGSAPGSSASLSPASRSS